MESEQMKRMLFTGQSVAFFGLLIFALALVSCAAPAVSQAPASTKVPIAATSPAATQAPVASTPAEPQASPTTASAPAPTPTQIKPITLRLAVSDAQGSPSEPYVLEFVDQVKTLSDGNITIEPIWDAGADTTPSFEQGVIKAVTEGKYDLGLGGSRAWDGMGVTSFEALQAPFLITNDDLAKAVATSDVAKRMLDSLSSTGRTGLALWPEDLRHPFSVVPGKSILSPQDFAGSTVRATNSKVTLLLIEKLGGKVVEDGSDYQTAESGLRQGSTLEGAPTATGNVTFFSKFQVLFANSAAFEKLSEAQRTVLREAAAATQKKAIAEHPSDVDNGAAWCADGGTIVMAGNEQIAAFEKAAQPVFDWLEQDPTNKELIAAIRELKAKTPASPGAAACAPAAAQPTLQPTAETAVWSPGLPPNGVWSVQLSTDDFVQGGMLRSVAQKEWAGAYTLTLQDGKMVFHWKGEQGQDAKCQANYAVAGDVVRFTYYSSADECTNEVDNVQWRMDDAGIHFQVVTIENGPLGGSKTFWGAKPWQKVK
jgi:TRAP-type C4-dicarboxylate transport system substrate-binding protein